MAGSKKASIKITSDSSEAKKGIDSVTQSLNKLSKNSANDSVTKLTKSVSGLNKAIQSAGWGAIIKAEVDLLKNEFKAIKDCSEALNGQIKAEKQLETAAKGNPYINGESVQNLEEYAGKLRDISEFDDDEMIPMMAQLVASGRNEAEVMQIMSAAVDAATGSGKDLGSVVEALNKSYSGQVGQLGKLLPSVSDLTTEQLKSGDAVRAIQTAYEGQAKALSDSTGSYKKMKDAAGDFQKAVGKITKPSYDMWNNFWLKFYEKGTKVINALSDKLGNLGFDINISNALSDWNKEYNKVATAVKKGTVDGIELKQMAADYAGSLSEKEMDEILDRFSHSKNLSEANKALKERILIRKENLEWAKKEQAAQEAALKAELSAKDTTTEKNNETKESSKSLLEVYNETVKRTEDEIAANKALGKTYEETAEKEELLKAKMAAFVSYVQSGGDIESAEAQGIIKDIQALSDSLPVEKANETADALADVRDILEEFAGVSIEEQIEQLKEYRAELEKIQEKGGLSDSGADKVQSAINNIDGQIDTLLNKKKLSLEDYMSVTQQFVSNMVSTMNTLSEMVTTNAENEATVQTAALEKQYAAGEISEEEYYDQKEKIEKEAAQKQYKIQMWQWSASLLQIGVSTAQGIMSAMKDYGPVAGAILATSVGIMGAAQLAAAIANKPIPPSYATGGVVGGMNGVSMGSDNTYAHVRNGEMILNGKQQLALWKAANGQSSGGMAVSVKNYMGGQANVAPQITSEGLQLIIRQTVANDLENRRLNSSLLQAQNTFNGINYQS